MISFLFDKIKSDKLRSFAYRTWNTFKSVIVPIVLPLVLIELENNPGEIVCLLSGSFWLKVAYAVVVALVGGALAGIDKVARMSK